MLRLKHRHIAIDQLLDGVFATQGDHVAGDYAGAFIDVVDHVDLVRVFLRHFCRRLSKARGQIPGAQIVGHDVGAVLLYMSLRIRLPDGKSQTVGRIAVWWKGVRSFHRERSHHVARSLGYAEGDADFSAPICHGGNHGDVAESFRVINGFEILNAVAYQLVADFSRGEEAFLFYGDVRHQL